MDVNKFLRFLYQKKLLLITIPVLTVIITFFLSKNLIDTYSSEAQISTGIVDETQQLLLDNNNIQESKINQRFSNLIEIMRLKKMVDLVSYRLMIHDLTNKKPFRKPSQDVKDLNPSARAHAIEVYEQKYKNKEPLSLWNQDQKGLERVLSSMKYDEASLKKKLLIYRNNNSDFITISFESEDPDLSAFVVNTLCREFINYYTSINKENQIKGVNYLGKLLNDRKDSLDNKMAILRNYKIANNVINLNEQSKILYGSIMDFEAKKLESEKNVESYTKTLNNIDSKFNPEDRKYLESTLAKINQDILETRRKLRFATDNYIKNGFNASNKNTIDSLQAILANQINSSTDKYIVNPLASKEKLVLEKLNLEVSNDLAKYSINSIGNHLNRLNEKFKSLVPFDAIVQSLEREIDVASQEYLDILNKYNDSNMQSNYKTKLRLIQTAMPGLPQPSKKMLLVILSGIISFIFCAGILFVIFWFDKSVTSLSELKNLTKQPVLGELDHIDAGADLKETWINKDAHSLTANFKNQMRSLRFEIKKNLLYKNDKVLGITSMSNSEGKTFFSLNLAYSFAMLNKRVLLIDGDFDNPNLSESVNSSKIYLEDYIKNKYLPTDSLITVLANKGGDLSLFETIDESNIQTFLDELKDKFDIIIVDTCSLKSMNKAKEWLMYTDKYLGVFKYGKTLADNKIEYTEYLGQSNKYLGWVFNDVKKEKKNSIFS